MQWAGTDSLIKPDRRVASTRAAPSCTSRPWPRPITVSYNLSGVTKLIKLDAADAGQDLLRPDQDVERPGHRGRQPGRHACPSTPIVVVHRSDASGTTNNFTHYLTLAACDHRLDAGHR